MRNIVVAMVGSRDVRYKLPLEDRFRLGGNTPRADYPDVVTSLWGHPNPDAENLRAISEKLLNLYRDQDDVNVTNDTLELPILQPALDYILDYNDRIDILILIVTDQPGISHNRDDTIHCGELIEQLIQARLGRDRIASIEKEVFRDPPNQSDRMYRTVRTLLQRKIGGDDKLFVLPSSGTPAISAALTHAGMNLYDQRCTAVQVDRPATDPTGATPGNAHALTPTPYLMDAVRLGAKELIKHGNYSGALDVLERFGTWPDRLFDLLKHARARVNLHRRGASEHAAPIITGGIIKTPRLGAVLQLPRGSFATLGYTNELRFLIDAALDQERYADALFRIIQFHESCRSIFSIGMLVSDYDRFNEHVMDYLKGKISTSLTSNREVLEGRLREITNWEPWQGWWKVTDTAAKNAVFDSAKNEAVLGCQACQNAKDLIEHRVFYNPDTKLDLAKVRNEAIHTPGGVSRAIIENTVRGYVPDGSDSEPLEYLKTLLDEIINNLYACFDQTRSENPYPVLEQEMLSLLDQEVEL